MCKPEWGRARVQAQRLADLARLRRVRDRIDGRYARPLDVEALAREEHLSAGDLSRRFREAYGMSPYAYLMTRRVERAAALLRRGDLGVTEVCSAVGCASPGAFTARFTELVGMPPGAYRRRASAGHLAAGTVLLPGAGRLRETATPVRQIAPPRRVSQPGISSRAAQAMRTTTAGTA
ncbi:AraC family transcriptional regulator [Streptomyces racemochromogenes]|uniref:AraC family transcriptional regulator n=1 Tax=Streptomyces racemochromogenes TaxID=67353 RepID=A0ABW7PDQ7_9ACTN